MRNKIRYAIVGAVALAVAVGGAAYAAVAGGPPVHSPAGVVGPYYQGGPVSICVSQTDEGVIYVEEHSQLLGNCAAGYIQLTVTAVPTPTATPSP
jgi:hypothetical protein